jgi:mono/diheme cytochrome c family protein
MKRILRRTATSFALAVSLMLLALPSAKAADAGNGERIAKSSCAACHFVESWMTRDEVADAPPFVVIAGEDDFNADMLVFRVLGSHPKTDFALTRRQANDIAAYMSTLRP